MVSVNRDGDSEASPTGDRLDAHLQALAQCLDIAPPADDSDEHQRWPLYQRAICDVACHPSLLAALFLDPDDVLVAAVVTQMMEWVEVPQREQWIGLARNESDRQYACRRAREVDILRVQGAVPELTRETLSTWTDWLQIRLAETSTAVRTLDHLARFGRTKRIRRTAAKRLSTV
ncbi:hypothetical protein ACIBPB_33570 [Micromonospora sp. NPDC049836]|uniref:hypothetical protein n=1 Tax=Micromonospora sp. NPDC049836 TaxID=3364274 RepID=UPI003796BF28